jgi:putative transposase
MPREARWVMPGIPLHIVQRGINRDACFFSEADYGTYLHFLGSSAARFGCAVHAYCLMSNHVHLSDSYVLACYRYIELNPVRAGMVSSPAQYFWSSYATNADEKENPLLQSHPAYESLGQSRGRRAAAYKELCADALPAIDLTEIRKATSAGCVVGTRRRHRGRPPMVK